MTNSKIINLNIVQWNAQSLRPKLLEFESLLNQEKIHIAIISETWLEPESALTLKHYTIYRQDRDDSYGGIAIVVHTSVKSQLMTMSTLNPGIQVLRVHLLNCDHLENIVAVYSPSTVRTVQHDWDHIFSNSTNKTLVAGDFNGHHSNWSYRTDSRGSLLFDSILDNNFITMNDGAPTRIKLVNGRLQKSSPDISCVSTDIALQFDWRVLSESLGSDHLVIKIKTNIRQNITPTIRRNFKNADWEGYRNSLKNSFSNVSIPDSQQEAYDLFINKINTAADSFIPKIKICNNPQRNFSPKPYWNQELSHAVAERRLALAKLRANPTPDNLNILQLKISTAQKLIRKAKSKSWHDFCNSIDNVTSSTEMWQKMRWLKGYKLPRCQVDKEKANYLLRSLAPDFASPNTPAFTSVNLNLSSEVSMCELEKAIKNKDTAPGRDGISFSMIKNLPMEGKSMLLSIYNRFLRDGYVPIQWRKVNVVPIPKASAVPNANPGLRPIALMSCPCKIFHSILNHRLEWYLEKEQFFSNQVVGFRKSRSCIDSLTRLVSTIQLGLADKKVTLGCFIDIQNAYNNVDITVLLNTLDGFGVGVPICNYLFEFLRERHLSVRTDFHNTEQDYRTSGRGLAQGDPMSPLLFNVATAHICRDIINVYVSQYADDFVLYASNINLTSLVTDIQTALTLLVSLVEKLGLQISTSKTKVCLFSRGSKRQRVNIKINDSAIQLVDSVKYLGLWLDRSLRWGRHINEISEKTLKFINVFKILSGSGWGIHPTHLRRLYIAVIRSRLDYCSFLYDNSVKSHLYKLDKIQNQAMRVIGGFLKSSPIHVMESELCIQPLHIRRRYLASKFWLRSKSLKENLSMPLVSELSNSCKNSPYWRNKKWPALARVHELLFDLPIHCSDKLEMFSMNTWVRNIDIDTNIIYKVDNIEKPKKKYDVNRLNLILTDYIVDRYRNFHTIFTDGSRDNTGVGAAFLDTHLQKSCSYKISSKISIMFAELFAIAEALEYAQCLNSSNIVIFSDSRSALQHIARCTSNVRCAPIAYTILKSICDMKYRNKNVILQWIPSHVGLAGNEQVDQLAKTAIVGGSEKVLLPFYTDLITDVKLQCQNAWNEHFDERSVSAGVWYKTIQSSPPRIPWFDRCEMSRNNIVLAMRIRSGHIPTNKFGFLMKKVPSPNCSECGVLEDATHLLLECVRNESFRRQIYHNDMFNNLGGCNVVLASPLSDEAKLLYTLVKIGLKNRS